MTSHKNVTWLLSAIKSNPVPTWEESGIATDQKSCQSLIVFKTYSYLRIHNIDIKQWDKILTKESTMSVSRTSPDLVSCLLSGYFWRCCCHAKDENILLSLNHELLGSSSRPTIADPVIFMAAWQRRTIDRHGNGWVCRDTHTCCHKIETYCIWTYTGTTGFHWTAT